MHHEKPKKEKRKREKASLLETQHLSSLEIAHLFNSGDCDANCYNDS